MNKENKTLSGALLVLLNDYEKGNVSSIKFSMDATLVNEKLKELELKNEKLKSDLKIAVDALNKNKEEWEVVHPNGFKCLVAWQMCRDTVAALQARIDGYEKNEGEK